MDFEKITLLPLSAAQFGIWLAQRLDPDSPAYNLAEYVEIAGPVDPGRFEAALRQVVAQTDALHIRAVETEKGPVQYLKRDLDWVMPFIDVTAEADPRAAAEAWMYEDMCRAVDLTVGPLFGYALFRAAPDRSPRMYLHDLCPCLFVEGLQLGTCEEMCSSLQWLHGRYTIATG